MLRKSGQLIELDVEHMRVRKFGSKQLSVLEFAILRRNVRNLASAMRMSDNPSLSTEDMAFKQPIRSIYEVVKDLIASRFNEQDDRA